MSPSAESASLAPPVQVSMMGAMTAMTDYILARCVESVATDAVGAGNHGKATDSAAPATLLYYDVAVVDGADCLLAVLESGGGQEWLACRLDLDNPIPSMGKVWPAMIWPERELAQKSGREVLDHPQMQPVFQPHRFLPQPRATGAGVFTLPLGPVRADVTESALFLFETVGEQIVSLQPQLFYKHRGIEQMVRGQTPENALLLAERISGTSSFNHAYAFAQAVEQAAGKSVPETVQLERILFSELERLYNHAGDMSQIASAAGMTVGQAQLARIKEELLRLNANLTGSRYLHGAVKLCGASGMVWQEQATEIHNLLEEMNHRLEHYVKLLQRTPTFVDRLVGTGIVDPSWVREYSLVGPVARACGGETDSRSGLMTQSSARSIDFSQLGFRTSVSQRRAGDAKDRFDVRVQEWRVSLAMVDRLLNRLVTEQSATTGQSESTSQSESSGESAASWDVTASLDGVWSSFTGKSGWGVGIAEGPRGRIAHVVHLNEGKIEHYGVRSASAWNWPVFGLATANGNIQTDFPVIDASFGLSYAGIDR